jgi:hypothetical protein
MRASKVALPHAGRQAEYRQFYRHCGRLAARPGCLAAAGQPAADAAAVAAVALLVPAGGAARRQHRRAPGRRGCPGRASYRPGRRPAAPGEGLRQLRCPVTSCMSAPGGNPRPSGRGGCQASASLVRTGRRGRGARVCSTEPARISANEITTAGVMRSPSTAAPRTTATAGLRARRAGHAEAA